MAKVTRGRTFTAGEVLSPSKLNDLVNSAILSNFVDSDLGSARFYKVGDTSPGVSNGNIWLDTSGDRPELKYAFQSPNASISSWLRAWPMREAYYWTETACSMGSPLFLLGSMVGSTEFFEKYDELLLPKVSVRAGASSASNLTPYIVVATEARSDEGPVRAAWAGLVESLTHSSEISAGDPLFVDVETADQFSTNTGFESLLSSLVSAYNLLEHIGHTKLDNGPNGWHLSIQSTGEQRATLPGSWAAFRGSGSPWLQAADSTVNQFGDEDFTICAWINANAFDNTFRPILSKRDDETGAKESYNLFWHHLDDRLAFAVSDDGENTSTIVEADELGVPQADTWYLVTAWHDSVNDEIAIQVDDGTPDKAAHSTGIFESAAKFAIARVWQDQQYRWNGNIGSVYIFNKVLSSAEISSIHALGPGGVVFPLNNPTGKSIPMGLFLGNASATNPAEALLYGSGSVFQDIVP